jgi:hypothetical protein
MTKIFYHKSDGNACVFDDDANISDWPDFQETKPTAAIALEKRTFRDTLLLETDWWGVSDLTMTDAQTTYRQALRDIPDQEGFPENIVWPIKPE